MKIMILNGSPHMKGHTMAMVDAFMDGAKESGHEVILHHVALMNIKGCLGCECCHQKEDAQCVQKDDMQLLSHDLQTADMVVFASPVYYFTLSAQMQSVIQRTYAYGILKNVRKTALIMSSGSPYVYGPALAQYYQSIVEYWHCENAGIFTSNEKENNQDEIKKALYAFGKQL